MSGVSGRRLLRSEIPKELTWNLDDLFVSTEMWEAELEVVEKEITSVTDYKGKLASGVEVFIACLNAYESFQEKVMKVSAYARLRLSEDGTNPKNQEKNARVGALLAKIGSELSFLESEILDLPSDLINDYLNHPRLQDFNKFLSDLLAIKPYRLNAETETVLAALGEVHQAPYMIYQRTKAADMHFDSIKDEANNELAMSFALYEDRYRLDPLIMENYCLIL